MIYTKKTMFDRVLSALLAVIMVVAMMPTSMVGVAAEVDAAFGTVTTLTGGTVTNNGTANVEVLVENTTLQWVEANALRAEGWWVGIDVVAPDGFSADATYKVKTNPTAAYGNPKSFAEMKDGEKDIQLWFPVSAESLEKFASEKRNLTMTYAFDWDANEEYEQTIVFSVVPSDKIVLKKNGVQVYPEIANYGTVTTLTGGTVKDNGTADVEVFVKETTLQWVEANALRAEGWWVGIDVVAPDGFSADATYKVKTNPTAAYGNPKSFAEMKDGEKDIQLWFPVSAESLEKFASEGRNLTMTYAFDWNANAIYEQTIAFSVVPSEQIVLMKGQEQVYPVQKSTVTVSKNEGGTVSLNGDTTGTLTVANGTTVDVVVKAENGYQISKVSINGQETVVDSKDYTTAIEKIAADAAVAVTFVKLYTVTVSSTDRGTVSTTPAGQGGSVTVAEDTKVTVTATPEEGYRVSSVTINDVAQTVEGNNDDGYSVELTVNVEYTVQVTFAPNIYKVEKDTLENGDIDIKNATVEYDGSTVVYVMPDSGYTVDTFTAEGATVSALTKDDTGIWFTVSSIKSDLKVQVTFKKTASAEMDDVNIGTENVIRKDEKMIIVRDGDVTFTTEKSGMRIYSGLDSYVGDAATQSINVPCDTIITSMELYYQDENELYADWHVVGMNDHLTVVKDLEKPEVSLEPDTEAINGYYNSDVTLNVNVEDQNYYSGIYDVEYWITYNGHKGEAVALTDSNNVGDKTYTDSIVVDAETYNSDDVVVTVQVMDRAGNVETVNYALKINATAPVYGLKMDGNQNTNALPGFYETERTLTVTVVDRESTFSAKAAAEGLKIKKNGEEIAVGETDIQWKHIQNSDTHIGTYTFKDEGVYEWAFAYKNLAGTAGVLDEENSDVDIYSFVIDYTAPTDLEITYTPGFVDTFLENVTFGFYSAPVQVTIQATDNMAGIQKFVYSYTVQDGASVTNSGLIDGEILSENFATNDGKTATATFEIPAQFRGKVSFSAVDKSGQISELKTDNRVVVVDNVAPGIVVEYTGLGASNDQYYNGQRTAKIEITEANFFEQDLDDELLVITVGKTLNNGTATVTKVKPEFEKNGDVYTATIEFTEDADYTFDIQYTDRSGNVYDKYEMDEFTIDTIAPEISVAFTNNTAFNEKYFNAGRTATITVVEHNFNESAMNVLINGSATQVQWTEFKNAADTYVAEVVFENDGHYTLEVSGADLAGNENDGVTVEEGTVAPWDFVIDKSAPVELKVTYEPTFEGILLETLTLGFYQAPVKVTIEAVDETAGVDYFKYSCAVQAGASSINEGKLDQKAAATYDAEANRYYTTFTIEPQFRGRISFTATDKAGNSTPFFDERVVLIDDIAPVVDVTFENNDVKNGKYYDADRTALIEITEANFFQADLYDELLVIKVEKKQNGGTYASTNLMPTFVSSGDVHTTTVKFTEDGTYILSIAYTDRSGNVADGYTSEPIVIDKTKPVISVAYDNNTCNNGDQFNADRKATITVTEENFTAATVYATVTANGTAVDTAYLNDDANWKHYTADYRLVATAEEGKIHVAEIEFTTEAHYTFDDIWCTDLAGNTSDAVDYGTSVAPTKFTLDKSAPTEMAIKIDDVSVLGTDSITFNTFYKDSVTVKLSADCDISGLESLKYQKVASAADYDVNGAWNDYDDATGIPVDPSEKFIIYFRAEDRAGNVTIVNSTGIVLDDKAPTGEQNAPEIDILPESDNDGYYNGNVVVDLKVIDPQYAGAEASANGYYSGLNKITYKIYTTDTDAVEEGVLLDLANKTEGAEFDADNLVKAWNGNIAIDATKFNSNNVIVLITAIDNAGNERSSRTAEGDIKIDMTPATIEVSYDNNDGDTSFPDGVYFKADRTATIVVTERNFDESLIQVVAKNLDGNDPEIGQWKHAAGDGNGDNSTHILEIKFTEDGDYTLEVSGTDKAGHKNDGIAVDGTVAPWAFTIDKTAPTVSITYYNDDVYNENHYKAQRIATITVTEHNFETESGRLVITSATEGDVAESAKPQVSTWDPGENEDEHVATITYSGDAKYVFDFDYTDKAGNPTADIAKQTFYVDKTAPANLKITYKPSVVGVFLENATFGFYKAPVEVMIEATDDLSGVDYFEYSYAVQDGASSINKGKLDQVVAATRDGETNRYYTTFTIEPQFRGHVYFTAYDMATNEESTVVDEKTVVVVDDIAPGITVKYEGPDASNDKYYNGKRTAKIEITEANFFGQDLEDELLVIKVGTKQNLNDEYSWTKQRPAFTKDGDVYTAEILFDQNLHYAFDIKYTDRSGNVYDEYEMDEFTVDTIAPEISVSFNNNTAFNDKYFNDDRTATITVVEHNFNEEAMNVLVNGSATQVQWTKLENAADTYIAEVPFTNDGHYTFEVSGADLAGNKNDGVTEEEGTVAPWDFVIDKTNPGALNVTYEPTFEGILLETLTLGFYQAPVKVTIEAVDETAGVDYFKYSYTVQAGASSINVGKLDEEVVATRDGETNRYYTTFTIEPQFRGHVYFTAYDMATNNKSTDIDEKTVVVDDIAPVVKVTYDNNDVKYDESNNEYYDADRTATIKITEANFFRADLDDGLLVITKKAVYNDGTQKTEVLSPEFSKNGDVYTATELFDENADYTFTIAYTDRAGNVAKPVSYEFTIDKIAPAISVEYDNNSAKNGDQFKENRTATITVVEHNFVESGIVAKVNGEQYDLHWEPVENVADTYYAEVDFPGDNHYTFSVDGVDLAGHSNEGVNTGDSVAPWAFTVDNSAPTEMAININDVSVLGTNSIAFDTFYKDSVTVKLSADCDISGLESLKYQKVDSAAVYNENGTWLDYDSAKGIPVSPSEKFIIYFRAEDRAGNVTIVNSTGIVVDDKEPIGEQNAPEIDILPEKPNDYGYHDGDVVVGLNVVDPKYAGAEASANGYYSGLNKITYKIYTTDTDAVEEGVLLDLANKTEGAEFDADNLVKAWAGSVTINATKFNSNNVIVVVTAIDNAGNERTSRTLQGDIQIDITPATIDVTYDNNDGDTSFDDGTYFKAKRTATIVITERNFDESLIQVVAKNHDGNDPEIGQWTPLVAGDGNGDNSTHILEIKFTEDGDYTLEVSCVDLAENPNIEPTTGDSLAPWEFTIDMTAPEVVVTYDNNDARNGNYYNAQRIATIKVTEHNFETTRIKVSLNATDDGVNVNAPAVSKWVRRSENEDVYIATITYRDDARYVFDFEYFDKAGNKANEIAEQTFYVDKTNPVLTIEGIVDESANNDAGNIGFVMTATDTNFDVFTPVLTGVVKNGNTFETKQLDIGEMTDIKNGKVYTVTNIEEDGIYRIMCTLVDKAGNAYSEVILENADGETYTEQRSAGYILVTFSVNREGSTFEIDSDTAELVEQYYVQNVQNDVVIVEINADHLKEHTVTLNGKALEQDEDYTVTEEGGNGSWMKYTYKVNKDLFDAEGEYKLVVFSKDKADNDAFSDIKEAAIEFVVDRRAPVVTVSGIANNGRYQTDKQLVTLIPTDDGGALNSLVVNMLDADGKVIREVINLSGEAFMAELEANGGQITFEIAEGLYQNVQIICTDCATGETQVTNTTTLVIDNVSVSTSGFMIFWANKSLRWGTIGGVSAAIALAVFVILKKKKRK